MSFDVVWLIGFVSFPLAAALGALVLWGAFGEHRLWSWVEAACMTGLRAVQDRRWVRIGGARPSPRRPAERAHRRTDHPAGGRPTPTPYSEWRYGR